LNKERLAEVLRCAERLCAERGVRLTRQRRTVLGLLCASETPLSAYELLERMRLGIRNPAPPTVYRALDFLLEQGLAHRLESLHAFVGCTHPDHPHAGQFLICSDCGDVEELENKAVMQSLRSAAMAIGFETRHPVVELLGTCAQCARRQPRSP